MPQKSGVDLSVVFGNLSEAIHWDARKLSISQHFWCPKEKQTINLLPPTLQFSDGATLPAPQKRDYREFQEHYRQRLPLLHKVGCLDIPFLMNRVVHFAVPKKARQEMHGTILSEEVIELCDEVAQRKDFQPLRSLLVLRDGRECEGELEAIYTAEKELRKRKFFTEEVTLDIVDFHKSIAKNPRLWEKMQRNRVEQILEGQALILDNRTIVLATTGAPTLHQGTADPVMLVGRNDGVDMVRVTKAVYASTHLNFSNPNVAQKLPLELKRTDDALTSRDSQEIRRIR